MRLLPFPQLQTDRLTLREVTSEDVPELFFLRSDEEMMRFIDRPRAQQESDVLPLVQKIDTGLLDGTGITWAIGLNDRPAHLIGTIGFWRIQWEHFRAEIGYSLHKDHWRTGLMSEALSTALEHGFGPMGLHSVEANINARNTASARLLERAGFVKEAHFRENYFWNGQFLDTIIYSKLAPS